jgi:hypothetical protein
MYGGDRDFILTRRMFLTVDQTLQDTTMGTGDVNPVSYSRIAENSPSYNTEFPNRILLSERNKTQGFFNAFRDSRDLITGITV